MTHPIPAYPNQVIPLSETIWANADAVASQWRSSTGSESNLYNFVNAADDGSYVWLRTANVIITDGTRDLRFDMATPSGDPNPYQNVDIRVRTRYYDDAANPSSMTMQMNLYENGSQVTGGGGATQNITTTSTDYDERLSTTAINNVSNWADVEVDMNFTAAGVDLDGEIQIRVYRVAIVFS